jgi:hypothetical protein
MFDVVMFLSLIQADGYNPLTVNSAIFVLPDANLTPDIALSLNETVIAHANSSELARGIAVKAVKNKKTQAVSEESASS